MTKEIDALEAGIAAFKIKAFTHHKGIDMRMTQEQLAEKVGEDSIIPLKN